MTNATEGEGVEREHHVGAGVGEPPEPYCQVVRAGSLVFIAGQVALDEDWQVVGRGDPLAQAEQVWRNLERAAVAAGGKVTDIVKITVFLADIRDAAAEMEVRARYFEKGRWPVCTQVQVANLGLPELLMEVDALAIV
jgi:enamine deaminase RidA (YjgF/YER057c/UK114 family)